MNRIFFVHIVHVHCVSLVYILYPKFELLTPSDCDVNLLKYSAYSAQIERTCWHNTI